MKEEGRGDSNARMRIVSMRMKNTEEGRVTEDTDNDNDREEEENVEKEIENEEIAIDDDCKVENANEDEGHVRGMRYSAIC